MITELAIAAAGAAVWTVRLRAALRPAPVDAVDADGAARTSIIVPARDEAHNLPALLASLRALDPAPREVIVVDDGSTDGTAAIARAGGARVVTPPPLPPGWTGKPWACRAGAAVARGDYLLFTDADTVHAPASLGRAVARARATGAALLSVVPTHALGAAWERLQGVFQLLLLIATRAGGRDPAGGERRFSIGQYLLFQRAAYDRIGGHARARHRIAEDLALARAVRADGLGFETVHAPGMLRVRMYPDGFAAFVRGWRRSFRDGMAAAGAGGVAEMVVVIGWLLGVALAAAGGSPVLAVAYAATSAEVARRQRALGPFPAWSAPLYPVFVIVFVAVSALAALDRARRAPVHWKQRVIAPPEARGGTS